MIGSVLVILIIFLFLRNFRSTLIVCTSIPISVVGTFALLYFGGLTLNTMTFGGLALGVGMIVDAAIVVLENSFRHMEHHGKDRMTASIDGSEEVWSAILASILTHIAVFVPLLFLTGVSSILFRQLSVVVVLLAGDVAVRRGHARAGALLAAARAAAAAGPAQGLRRTALHAQRAVPRRHGRRLPAAAAPRRWPSADVVVGVGAASVVAAVVIFPTLPTEFATQTDEGQVQRQRRAAAGHAHRAHRPGAAAARERRSPSWCPKRRRSSPAPAAAAASAGRAAAARSTADSMQHPAQAEGRAEALERSDRAGSAPSARRHSRRHRPRERVGRQPAAEPLPLGRQQRRRPALARDPRRQISTTRASSRRPRKICSTRYPGVADARLGRDEGRPELAVRVDRAKAALLGLSATTVANTIRTNVAGTQAALFRAARQGIPDHRPAARRRAPGGRRRRATCWSARRSGQVLPGEEPDARRRRRRPDADSAQEPAAHRLRQRRAGSRR